MLLTNFFYIDKLAVDNSTIHAEISINSKHPILEGHFPNQPIVPGVCMIEMLKEVIQWNSKKKYQLESASTIKFLTMFTPQQFTKAQFIIQVNQDGENKLEINATLAAEATIFLKFKGVFIEK